MNRFQELVTRNPMMAEAKRTFRRYFDVRRPGLARVAVVAMLIMAYAVSLLTEFAELISVATIIFLVLCFAVPALLHGAIAGERERRSWDFLLAAPVSHGQIVFGKFAGAALAVFAFVLAWVPTLAHAVITTEGNSFLGGPHPDPTWLIILNCVLFLVSFGWFLLSVTLFLSARTRRAMTAFGTTLGILFGWLVLLPIFSQTFSLFGPETRLLTLVISPLGTLGSYLRQSPSNFSTELSISPIWAAVVYFGFTVAMLFWTERTLRFADNDIKFMRNP